MDKGQMKKGILELCILLVGSQGEFYGYEIMKRVTEAFPELNESTVYAILRRLHADSCTESYVGEFSGGPKRKYYKITDIGKERLCRMKDEWNEMLRAAQMLGLANTQNND